MNKNRRRISSTGVLLNHLEEILNRYSTEAAVEKKSILLTLQLRSFINPQYLKKFHECLCFLQSYPDDPELLTIVNKSLQGFNKRIEDARSGLSFDMFERLNDTGIAGTSVRYPFSYQTAKWLSRSFPGDTSIDWDNIEDDKNLLNFLPCMVERFEEQALDDDDIPTEDWMKNISALTGKTDHEWLCSRLEKLSVPENVRESIHEIMDIPVEWRLGENTASRTNARMSRGEIFYQGEPLLRRGFDIKKLVRKRLVRHKTLSLNTGKKMVQESLKALSVLRREIYPLFYANPEDVTSIYTGRGLTIILIGMKPGNRMPIESTYFFLLIRNRIPVGYGCGTLLFDQAEIAANIFDTFRRGESAFIYTQLMRVFHNVFGARVFFAEKFQVGAYGNKEAIDSGAFWFYYKIGFIPVEPGIAKLAAKEKEKIDKTPGYRTGKKTLRAFAESDMRYYLGGRATPAEKINLGQIGLFSSENIAKKTSTVKEVCSLLKIRNIKSWTKNEMIWLKKFSPIITRLPGIGSWKKKEKKELADIIRAKGQDSEVSYINKIIKHHKLQKSLCALGSRGKRGYK